MTLSHADSGNVAIGAPQVAPALFTRTCSLSSCCISLSTRSTQACASSVSADMDERRQGSHLISREIGWQRNTFAWAGRAQPLGDTLCIVQATSGCSRAYLKQCARIASPRTGRPSWKRCKQSRRSPQTHPQSSTRSHVSLQLSRLPCLPMRTGR